MLKGIIEKCDKLVIYQKRCVEDKYCELVFYSKDIDEWDRIFTEICDQAIKPAQANPTKYDLQLTKDYGGICANQTLFKKELDNAVLMVMFWPWQDGTFTTLKMAVLEKQ